MHVAHDVLLEANRRPSTDQMVLIAPRLREQKRRLDLPCTMDESLPEELHALLSMAGLKHIPSSLVAIPPEFEEQLQSEQIRRRPRRISGKLTADLVVATSALPLRGGRPCTSARLFTNVHESVSQARE